MAEHIRKNLPSPDRAVAASLLNALSQHPEGEHEETLFAKVQPQQGSLTKRQVRDILDMLCNDGLITVAGKRYAFQSGLVRRYWKEYEVD